MFHWFGVVTNTRGDALPGWQVGLVQVGTETVVPIYSDENSTPIINVSGVANRAVADDNGNYDFFVPSGTYTLQFYNPSGVFQRQQRFVAMFGADAANTANLASNAAGKGASLVATEGSGTVQTALNARPTSAALAASGGAALVGVIQSGTGATARTVQDKLRETVSVKDFGASGDNVADDSAEIQAAAADGKSFVFPPGTYKSDTAVTGQFRAVSFGATFTGTNAFDAAYPGFGPGALKVFARGTSNNAIIGIVHNTAPAGTQTFPTGVTGYGRNDNAGNQVFGIYAEARQHATSGVACNELDSFNMTATAPSSNLPPALGIGTAENHPIALQVGAGGTANSSIGIHICQEGSSPQKFLTGIYMNHAALVNHGLVIDAVAGSTYLPALIKHGVGAIGLQLQGVGTPVSNGAAAVYVDGGGVTRWEVKQDGRQGFSTAITQSTRGAAGAATALPSNPTGYLKVLIGGVEKVIPYYEAV